MTAIGKGDWVECVDVTPRTFNPINNRHLALLTLRAIYQVESVLVNRLGPTVRLTAIPQPPGVDGFMADRFRPIHPGGALTRLLMEPVSVRIEPGVSRKSRQGNPATADQ